MGRLKMEKAKKAQKVKQIKSSIKVVYGQKKVFSEALQLIQKDLDLIPHEINTLNSPGIEELKRYLESAISELLDKDFNKLLNALYRMDVSEQKVTEILHESPQEQMAQELAAIIIERQLQKVETRRKYS